MDNPRERGLAAEELALRYLCDKGYTVLTTNYRCPRGEIDLICLEGETLAFVEVRSRRDLLFGSPLETVNSRKQARIIRTAEHYLASCYTGPKIACRFDVLSIVTENQEVTLVRDAFRRPSAW